MKQKESINKIIIIGLAVLLCLVWMIAADRVNAAPIAVTVTGTTTCNNGVTERVVAGTMTTTCGDGWNIGPLGPRLPILRYSDLITGPDYGLGDGFGEGVIVTVWGQNLGSTQGASTIEYCDSLSVCRPGHVYYWKNADGQLPGGPANTYESHRMQEIAFSIPDSAMGLGRIKVVVGGVEAVTDSGGDMPFTVRPGSIYHVMPTGDDSTGDGSFANPWLTVARADAKHSTLPPPQTSAGAGDTIYIHSVVTTAPGTTIPDSYAIYNNKGFVADESNQLAYVAYPNRNPSLVGMVGANWFETSGIVVSKLHVFASNCADETLSGCTQSGTLGITVSDNGRAIGNAVTDRPGMCASGQSGAITTGVNGGFSYVSNAKAFGNYVYDYGCPNSDKLHHTTYFTIRDITLDRTFFAPRVAFNYLKDNDAKNGIHFYDENSGAGTECGQFSNDVLIHDNVVVNQGGNGIAYESACGWTNDARIYNNVLINVGLPVDLDCTLSCGSTANGIQILDGTDNGILGDVYVHNNTIHIWDSQNQVPDLQACVVLRGDSDNVDLFVNDNVCYTTLDRPFYKTFSFIGGIDYSDNTVGAKNVWYTTVLSPTEATTPTFDSSPIKTNPLHNLNGSQILIGTGSSVTNQSATTLDWDIYGVERGVTSNAGAIQ